MWNDGVSTELMMTFLWNLTYPVHSHRKFVHSLLSWPIIYTPVFGQPRPLLQKVWKNSQALAGILTNPVDSSAKLATNLPAPAEGWINPVDSHKDWPNAHTPIEIFGQSPICSRIMFDQSHPKPIWLPQRVWPIPSVSRESLTNPISSCSMLAQSHCCRKFDPSYLHPEKVWPVTSDLTSFDLLLQKVWHNIF